jgi:hypothetical protein
VSAKEAFVSGQRISKRMKIIIKNSANKYQKPSRLHVAGKIMTACYDKL